MKIQDLIKANQPFSYQDIKNKQLATHIQQVLVWHKILESPVDGKWGRFSTFALCQFQKIHNINENFLGQETIKALINIHPDRTRQIMQSSADNFLTKVVRKMKLKKFKLFTHAQEINIVYVEGVDSNFTLNANTPNVFNDLCIVFTFFHRQPRLLGKWIATSDPGRYYTDNPMNRLGALHHNGQATAWQVGRHKTHEALLQVKPIQITRDYNRDFRTEGDKKYEGRYGANCHGSQTNYAGDIGKWSAGCKVILGMRQQSEFMAIVKSDPNYRKNSSHLFTVATLEGTSLLQTNYAKPKRTGYSEEEKILARTIWGEGRGESREGKIAIAHTVLNRFKISQATKHSDWWGNSISEICKQPWQFSAWNYNDPNREKMIRVTTQDKIYREALEIARDVIAGLIPDNTGGATHYFNSKVVFPNWASEMNRTASIGNHVFYR